MENSQRSKKSPNNQGPKLKPVSTKKKKSWESNKINAELDKQQNDSWLDISDVVPEIDVGASNVQSTSNVPKRSTNTSALKPINSEEINESVQVKTTRKLVPRRSTKLLRSLKGRSLKRISSSNRSRNNASIICLAENTEPSNGDLKSISTRKSAGSLPIRSEEFNSSLILNGTSGKSAGTLSNESLDIADITDLSKTNRESSKIIDSTKSKENITLLD
uniref:Uncharacterized protein n=1 Tax=Megaselia scalaris TaxID=36166 RepID=T1GA97_MEGSC